MTHLTGNQRAQYVQGMFTRIASSYDLMNRLMTFGQDAAWRKEVIQRADLPRIGGQLLDLGAGTGDLGFEALRKAASIQPFVNVEGTFGEIVVFVTEAAQNLETIVRIFAKHR